MKLIDFIILCLCIGFVCFVIYSNRKKAKLNKANGNVSCGGSCSGCSGCSSMKEMLNERKARK